KGEVWTFPARSVAEDKTTYRAPDCHAGRPLAMVQAPEVVPTKATGIQMGALWLEKTEPFHHRFKARPEEMATETPPADMPVSAGFPVGGVRSSAVPERPAARLL